MSKRIEWGYGFFPGGDPRKFHPDEGSCTPEEIASHRAACEKWEAGDTTALPGSCIHGPGYILTLSGFGIGSYEYEEDDGPWYPRCLRDAWNIDRLPRRLKKRLRADGWHLDQYGWHHKSWIAEAPPHVAD